MIRGNHLTKKYHHPLFEDLSFTVQPGEHLAVTAPSGKGKTTFLRILCGLTKPDAGSIEGVSAEQIAVKFQEPRLFPRMTALENVTCVLADPKAGVSRARELLEALELSDAENLYPAELSGGMQQRVALARALIVDRPVVLLDEPFAGLDPELKTKIIAFLRSALAKKTLFLVTHDREDADALTERTLTL